MARFSELEEEDSKFWVRRLLRRDSSFPSDLVKSLDAAAALSPDEADSRRIVTAFCGDRDWLYEGLKSSQPLAFAAFMEAADPVVMLIRDIYFPDRPGLHLHTYVEAGGRLIELDLQTHISPVGVDQLRSAKPDKFGESILGAELAIAYYSRTEGLGVVGTSTDVGLRGLPPGISDWEPLSDVVLSSMGHDVYQLDSDEKRSLAGPALDALAGQFEFVRAELEEESETDDRPYIMGSLRTFIDSRIEGDVCDQFDLIVLQTPGNRDLVRRDSVGRPIFYHCKDGQWDKLHALQDSVRAIDAYVAHLVRNRSERFDFEAFYA